LDAAFEFYREMERIFMELQAETIKWSDLKNDEEDNNRW